MKDPSLNKVIEHMMSKDRFSKWLGVVVNEVSRGACTIQVDVNNDMLNGFGIAHGGVTFAIADTALAIASNSYNRLSVALEASISYPRAVNLGDTLKAQATELSLTNKTGVYQILVTNQNDQTVAIFKGTVYRTSKTLYANE